MGYTVWGSPARPKAPHVYPREPGPEGHEDIQVPVHRVLWCEGRGGRLRAGAADTGPSQRPEGEALVLEEATRLG